MGVQGWGGLVTMALTANDPLNDQRKGGGADKTEGNTGKKGLKNDFQRHVC